MNQHIPRYFALVLIFTLVLSGTQRVNAEQMRYNTARDWRQWELPLGAVDLSASGVIKPTRIERRTDPVRDLDTFDGGIRDAGSNLNIAHFATDGDPTTGWAPDPEDDPDNWFIEVDLGRAISAHSVTLVFDARPRPSRSLIC
tara:strand:- start:469 stop:897 length:429 start_codon:yes stop_codon:yes gene_type:complete